ncbi:MAG: DMT family transporter [Betaproteobacteria bacterium]|nr:DMT family transporter [Betaproteobacteria bacterium]
MGGVSYRAWGLLFALGGVIGFSFRPIIVKLCYAEHAMTPVTLLFLRMTMALPAFAAVAWWLERGATSGKRPARLTLREWAAVGVLGFVGYYAASFLDFLGLQYVGAGIGRLIAFLYPTMVLALSFAFLHKSPSSREIAALVMSYAGVALVVSNQLGETPQDRLFLFGVLLCLSNALCYAVYLVAGGELTRRIGSMRFTAWSMLFAAIPAVLQFCIFESISALDLRAGAWGYLVVLVVFCTVLPAFMVAEALRRMGANHFAMIGALSPVITVIAGAIGLDEPLTLLQAAGGMLVVCGVLLVSLQPKAT